MDNDAQIVVDYLIEKGVKQIMPKIQESFNNQVKPQRALVANQNKTPEGPKVNERRMQVV